MQTAIAPEERSKPEVQISEAVLRTCVHCGFCNATCPTYQITGNELEGPRGRIYLMKAVLEGRIDLTASTVAHLDHCVSCFACMTTCPSGVHYSHLMDPMRARIERSYRRPLLERVQRAVLAQVLPYVGRFRLALRMGALARPFAALLPGRLGTMLGMLPQRVPPSSKLADYKVHVAQGARRARVALLTGCAQEVLGPYINDATIRFLARIGCEVVLPEGVGCCGALVFHMGNEPGSLPHMRNNIDRWYAEMQHGGLDYIVINTSGCGSVVKDYGHIFRDEPAYAEKAAAVSALTRDVSEVVHELGLPEEVEPRPPEDLRVAYHDACSLQHAQRVRRQPRELLRAAGFTVLDVPQGHLCCGSAGTYNMLQPENAAVMGREKAQHIATVRPDVVATANIGCMEQIAQYSDTPIVHTVELLDWATGGLVPYALRGRS